VSSDEQHYTDVLTGVNSAKYPKDTYYRAVCKTCGWMGVKMQKRSEAENDADEHVIAMTR
jgi:hypothetical protein